MLKKLIKEAVIKKFEATKEQQRNLADLKEIYISFKSKFLIKYSQTKKNALFEEVYNKIKKIDELTIEYVKKSVFLKKYPSLKNVNIYAEILNKLVSELEEFLSVQENNINN